jgi:uncharacterized OB-fold protein
VLDLRHLRDAAEAVLLSCQGTDYAGRAPGTGTVYTFTIVRHSLSPRQPMSCPTRRGDRARRHAGRRRADDRNIVDADLDTLDIGTKVKVVFEKVSDTLAVLRFTPA